MFGYHVSIEKAIEEYGSVGLAALKSEIMNMIKKKVFVPVNKRNLSPQQLKKIIPSFAFIKQKYKADGTKDKCKARLVAGGHRQDRTLYPEYSSPTVSIEHLFIESVIAANNGFIVESLDVGSAYLNADMEGEEIFMKLNKILSDILCQICPEYEIYRDPESSEITVQLLKALYGCIQSALLWYKVLKKVIEEIGFQMNIYD